MTTPMISCRDFVQFLAEYLAGELTGERKNEFELHLACCPSCVAYMKSYRATERLGRACLRDEEFVPADVPPGLIQAILAARGAGS